MNALERASWARPSQVLALCLIPAVHLAGAWPWVTAACALGAAFAVWRRWPRAAVVLAVAAALSGVWGARSLVTPSSIWPFAVSGAALGRGTVVAEAPVGRKGTIPFRIRIEEVQKGDWVGRASVVVTVGGYRGPSPATGSQWSWLER